MKVFYRSLLLVAIVVVAAANGVAQSDNVRSVIGLDLQVYPTGVIPGLRYEMPISSKSLLHVRAGYQLIDHRDLGKHEDETGTGYGLSLGYKRYLNEQQNKWSFMLKTDVWFNTIDWVGLEADAAAMGTTEIVVLQPTVQAEYDFMLSDNVALSPSVAFGLEWNVKTDGSPTGEGPILLLGLSLGYRL